MGISSNLYLFVPHPSDEDLNTYDFEELDDFEELEEKDNAISLYEILPKSVHHLIYSKKDQCIDIKKMREFYNNPELDILSISFGQNTIVVFNNDLKLLFSECLLMDVTFNSIFIKPIAYLGSKTSFKQCVYDKYNNNLPFPSIYKVSEIESIYDFSLGFLTKESLKKYVDKYTEDFLIIDLNY